MTSFCLSGLQRISCNNQEHLARGFRLFNTQDIRKLLKHQKNSSISLFSVFFTTLGIHQSRPVSSGQLERRYVPAAHGHVPNSHVSPKGASCRLACFTWETGRPSCLLFCWIRRGNNYTSKIHPGRASLRAWRPWNPSFHCTAYRPLCMICGSSLSHCRPCRC